MPKILNQKLYDLAKRKADQVYKKHSAYKSGYIVKTYKELGGKYKDDTKSKTLKRWYKEKWTNVGLKKGYPVYRPSVRINRSTPLTVKEIKKSNLQKQIKMKQIFKGKKNLPPFLSKV